MPSTRPISKATAHNAPILLAELLPSCGPVMYLALAVLGKSDRAFTDVDLKLVELLAAAGFVHSSRP
jgi:hypothetical protein